MKKQGKHLLRAGILLLALFALWTALVQLVDVRSAGPMGTEVGFAALNTWFHQWTGVHMLFYTLTDWMGLVPVFICLVFGFGGLWQMIKRRSLRKVDQDIILLGVYYLIVVLSYILFEMIPVNYRPIRIEGRLEASYPSSTTLLVLSVMPTLAFQAGRRIRNQKAKRAVEVFSSSFSVFMVLGRLISGVHWLSDIAGAVLLSAGLFCVYKAVVLLYYGEE